jgi:hypothetical protein
MIEIKVIQGPGRPRVRPDRETRQAIYEAAHYEFAGSCVYRKLKPERSGDKVRPKGRVNL